jgi:hypothetical protein
MARKLVTLLVIACFGTFVFAAAGCGGDDESASGDTAITETTTTEETETEDTDTETTETTETEDTDTTETETEAAPDFATSENCQEFAQIGTKISQAFTGTGTQDFQQVADSFDEFVSAAPAEIKDDFQVIADAYDKIADALQGVDLSAGETPDPQALAKLTQVSQELDQAKLTQASTNISKWAQENC